MESVVFALWAEATSKKPLKTKESEME